MLICMSSKSQLHKNNEFENLSSVPISVLASQYSEIKVEEPLRNLPALAVIFKKIILPGDWRANAWWTKSTFNQMISPSTKHLGGEKSGQGSPIPHSPFFPGPPPKIHLVQKRLFGAGAGGAARALSQAPGIRCGRLLSNKQPIEKAARSLLGLFEVLLKPPFKRWSHYNDQQLAMAKLALLIRERKSI